MKLIIAGGRNRRISKEGKKKLDAIRDQVTEVVSGRARGIDKDGEAWARKNGIPIQPFPADWIKYGDAAGRIRNKEMAKYADAVALFPGGKGTANMRKEAKLEKLKFFDVSSPEPGLCQ